MALVLAVTLIAHCSSLGLRFYMWGQKAVRAALQTLLNFYRHDVLLGTLTAERRLLHSWCDFFRDSHSREETSTSMMWFLGILRAERRLLHPWCTFGDSYSSEETSTFMMWFLGALTAETGLLQTWYAFRDSYSREGTYTPMMWCFRDSYQKGDLSMMCF